RSSSLFTLQGIDKFDHQEYRECYDQELDDHVDEISIIDGHFGGPRGFVARLDHVTHFREINTAGQIAEWRHNDVVYDRSNDLAKGCADNLTDSEVDYVAPHGELLEFF